MNLLWTSYNVFSENCYLLTRNLITGFSAELICYFLSFSFAALSAADRAGLVNVLKVRTPTRTKINVFPNVWPQSMDLHIVYPLIRHATVNLGFSRLRSN